MARSDDGRRSLLEAIFGFYSEVVEATVLSVFGPPVNRHDGAILERGASLSNPEESADDPLEVPPFMRHLEAPTRDVRETGREENVSDEFLSQLEQRTQQVKITLANLEAEKVRIEGLIAQLQPIIPHYDALVAAERQLSEARITLEPQLLPQDPPPAEGSGWSSEPPAGQEPSSGWSGSWNS